ncbi:GNAT family N-acetyltransferase [Myxacorys almedinensis]|uniref:GNAT family N-acetyltransferase n=1 Tax=Myxacorys almedinensis A TaxID=2690445 RepID=A0A8J8CME7_9CYAN|nr:GNAT family N-acetyltransferase [Myxacorys almedinensis]NDJ18635.1 GNAT family N-acetyltransferase [Myxacorys almedinensis A]
MQIPNLETPRLILRELCETDLDAYADMSADLDVMRHIGTGRPLSRPEAWRSLATMVGHWQLRGYGMWAVEERQTQTMVGRVGFWNPEGWVGFEIGWSLCRAVWGKGYATEGAQAALCYGFEALSQSHIISLIRPENLASRRVAEKIGETLEGTAEIMGGEALVYGIHRDRWKTLQQ